MNLALGIYNEQRITANETNRNYYSLYTYNTGFYTYLDNNDKK